MLTTAKVRQAPRLMAGAGLGLHGGHCRPRPARRSDPHRRSGSPGSGTRRGARQDRTWPLHTRALVYQPRSARAVRATEALRTRPRARHHTRPCLAPSHPVAHVPAPLRSGRSSHGGSSHPTPCQAPHPPVPDTRGAPGCSCTSPAPLGPFQPRRLLTPPTRARHHTRRARHLRTRVLMYQPRSARAVPATEAPDAAHPCLAPHPPCPAPSHRVLMYQPRSARAVRATEALRTRPPCQTPHPPCLTPGAHPVAHVPAPLRSRRSSHGGSSHPNPCQTPHPPCQAPSHPRAHVPAPLRSGRSSHGGS